MCVCVCVCVIYNCTIVWNSAELFDESDIFWGQLEKLAVELKNWIVKIKKIIENVKTRIKLWVWGVLQCFLMQDYSTEACIKIESLGGL